VCIAAEDSLSFPRHVDVLMMRYCSRLPGNITQPRERGNISSTPNTKHWV